MKKVYEIINKNELGFFCFITLLNAIYVFSFNFYHTLDGSSHLHNSNLLINIFSGNDLINNFYRINLIPVGNWTGNIILAFFNFLFPSSTALSFFLFTYFAGMAFSYRYLIKSINGTFKPIHYIIFPFFDNSCLSLGLFNFSTSLIVLFIVLGFWIRHNQEMNLGKWIKFSLLFVLLYFSHFLTYIFLGISLFLFVFYDMCMSYILNRKINLKITLIRIFKIFVVSIPSLIIALIYVSKIFSTVTSVVRESTEPISFLENFYYIRPLILFHFENDGSHNIVLFIGIVIIFIFALIQSFGKKKKVVGSSYHRNYILVLLIFFTVLVVILPPNFLLNTMRIRLTLMFFVLFVIWISMFHFSKWFHFLAAMFFIFITIYNKAYHRDIYKEMDKAASEINAFNKWLKPNTLLLPIYDSYFWMNVNIMSYVGTDKPIVNVNNRQAYGFFPILYEKNLPLTLLGNKTSSEVGIYFRSGNNKDDTKVIDYVLIRYPDKVKINKELVEVLNKFYTLLAKSADGNLVLYRLIIPAESIIKEFQD